MKLFLMLSALTVTLHTSKIYINPQGVPEVGMSACTGVFVSPNTILTAQHCVENSRGHQWIKTDDGKSYAVDIVRTDAYRDLALLSVPKITSHKFAKIGKQAFITEDVYTVNSGDDIPGTWGLGVVKNVMVWDTDTSTMIMHSIAILAGASGSGLFDRKGQLIGINTRAKAAISLAVNTADIKCFLANTCDNGIKAN